MGNLSANFSEYEFRSGKRWQPRIMRDEVPDDVLPNIRLLVRNILQPLRDRVGPLWVTTGYRSPEHNLRVGGEEDSHHLTGCAADIQSRRLSPRELAVALSGLRRDGVVRNLGEVGIYKNHVHVSCYGPFQMWVSG